MIDYSLWEVIKNAPPITKVVEGVETIIAPITAKEKAERRLELKARSTLLMGIHNEHQLKFNSIKDAKSLLLLGLIRLRWECYNFHKGVNFGRGSAGLHGNQENLKEGDHKKGNFMPLKPNFSFSGLEEFVNEPIVREPTVKKPVVKTSETKASEAKPKAVRKNKGAPIIKD
ncbi:hypothetical protein Tco_0532287 [Tanacetum coccineum]